MFIPMLMHLSCLYSLLFLIPHWEQRLADKAQDCAWLRKTTGLLISEITAVSPLFEGIHDYLIVEIDPFT